MGGDDHLYALVPGNPAPSEVLEYRFIVGSSAVGGTAPDGSARFGIAVPDDDGRCNSVTYQVFDGATGQVTELSADDPGCRGQPVTGETIHAEPAT